MQMSESGNNQVNKTNDNLKEINSSIIPQHLLEQISSDPSVIYHRREVANFDEQISKLPPPIIPSFNTKPISQ